MCNDMILPLENMVSGDWRVVAEEYMPQIIFW